ncbi:hypothetical protein MNBD_GAMMA26-324 [hydrothermal vent metagenome]|uniref:Type II secretion system protein GspC N-terminal domain-containing protein n=1 Tax=hydrothermal vent metagenome TaxID=652676 RepID=A0A3B1AU58_9ZZZZ
MATQFISRFLPAMATIGATTLLAYVGMMNLKTFQTNQPSLNNGTTATQNQPSPSAAEDGINLSQIPGWHLFGHAEEQPVIEAPPVERVEAPETPLELTLQGTLLGKSTTNESWAIISTPDSKQKMYKIGDEISGGAVLYAVEAFQVILTRNGRHESLSLPRPTMDESESTMTLDLAPQTRQEPIAPIPASLASENLTPAEEEQRALFEEMNRLKRGFSTQ